MTRDALSTSDLLAELPESLREGEPPRNDLADLIRQAGTGVPVSRLSRFWTLGTLQGKIAAAYAFWWVRGLWSDADERRAALNETHLTAALQLLGTMSYMRGAIMKVGQLLSHWPGIAPQEFADVLGRLQFQAPPMHFALLRESVRAELGADPSDLFDEFEPEAAAAASLGQVHRARLKGSGKRVAVKIQYPGIARAIASDFANLRALLAPARLGPDGDSLHDQLKDVESMLMLEVDYAAEADNLRLAARTLHDLPGVVVPGVHEALSTPRVLTMDWIEGAHAGQFLASSPTQAQRDEMGRLMTRAFMRLCYRAKLLYADLHPGNYIFTPDGRLGLIDFGCARRYTPDEVDYMTQAERAGFESPAHVRAAIIRGTDLTPSQQKDEARIELLMRWYDWMCEPTRTTAEFDFTDPEYLHRGMALWRECVRRRYVRNMPVNIWVSKSFIGLRAMLHLLRARVPMGVILREETCVDLPAGA